ncbi:conserved hypothetical protein [Candidatus Defluviicoccus seviourii]|uniref:ArsR family transcriptional regulator n=1 Tax=Candidatus Defluviicoccus seviourii TaxID=2565273 RepID=A0A564WHS3_9PROT|nr:conserved hypothetical protein [Candidatus Defluviicoccus seviourii]
MTALAELLAAQRRLAILQILAAIPGGVLNTAIIDRALDNAGLRTPRATVDADVTWLHGEALVTASRIGFYLMAEITQAGRDVAAGEDSREGVARPERL